MGGGAGEPEASCVADAPDGARHFVDLETTKYFFVELLTLLFVKVTQIPNLCALPTYEMQTMSTARVGVTSLADVMADPAQTHQKRNNSAQQFPLCQIVNMTHLRWPRTLIQWRILDGNEW